MDLRHDGGIVWGPLGYGGGLWVLASRYSSDGAWRLKFKLGPPDTQTLPAVTQVRLQRIHGTTSQVRDGNIKPVTL